MHHSRANISSNQVFYSIVNSEDEYMLKMFCSKGVLRMSRKIAIPKNTKDFYATDKYVVCISDQGNKISILDISFYHDKVRSCEFPHPAQRGGHEMSSIFYQGNGLNIIMFVCCSHFICYLVVNEDSVTPFLLTQNDLPIDKVQIDEGKKVRIITNRNIMKTLSVDWNVKKIVEITAERNVVDFHFRNGWDIVFREERIQDMRRANVKKLHINGEYHHDVPADRGISISSPNHYMYFFFQDNHLHLFFSIRKPSHSRQGEIIEHKQQVHFPSKMESIINKYESLCLVNINHYPEEKEIMELELHFYNEMAVSFDNFSFLIRRTKSLYLKEHIEQIFKTDGIVNPAYQARLEQMVNSNVFESDRSSDMSRPNSCFRLSNVNLACKTLQKIFECMPEQTIRLAKFLSRVKVDCLATELERFILICRKILENIRIDIPNILERSKQLRKTDKKSKLSSSFSLNLNVTVQKDKKSYLSLTANMSQFLYILSKEVERRLSIEKINKQNTAALLPYTKALNEARSVHLIVLMLIEANIDKLLNERENKFKHFRRQRDQAVKLLQSTTNLAKNQIPCLLLYEHFSRVRQLGINPVPDERIFINYLLTVAKEGNYYEVAYWFKVLTEAQEIPYMFVEYNRFYDLCLGLRVYSHEEAYREKEFVPNLPFLCKVAIKIGFFPFLKYIAQLATHYECEKYPILLFNCGRYIFDETTEQKHAEHQFMVSCLIAGGKVYQSYYLLTQLNLKKDNFRLFKFWVEKVICNREFKSLLQIRSASGILEKQCQDIVDQLLKQKMDPSDYSIAMELLK